MSKKIALITGATSGFGREFTKLFAKDGYDLVITAESASNLKTEALSLVESFGCKVWTHPINLAKPGAAEKLYEWSTSQKLKVNVLINNAGVGLYGPFIQHRLEDEQALVQLNVNTLTDLCHLYIHDMVKRGGGKVLNVASVAAFQAGPLYATYFASKAYVLLFSEALQAEYSDKNVVITALCPGVASTNFFKRAGMRDDHRMLTGYQMSAAAVAQAGYDALMKGKTMVVPGLRNKFISWGYRLLPRRTTRNMAHNLTRKAATTKPK